MLTAIVIALLRLIVVVLIGILAMFVMAKARGGRYAINLFLFCGLVTGGYIFWLVASPIPTM